MSLDNLEKTSILSNNKYEIARLIHRTAMGIEITNRHVRHINTRAVSKDYADLSIPELAAMRKAELKAMASDEIDVRSSAEKSAACAEYTSQEIRGDKLAISALRYLLGEGERHKVEFYVEHVEAEPIHTVQHAAYLSTLALVAELGIVEHIVNCDLNVDIYADPITGRCIRRDEFLHDDETGQAGMLRYADASGADAMTLIAEA
jgi:hypothetical protein